MKTPTILVIDDEEDFHRILRRILEPAGYKVVSAFSAEEALRMLDAFVPDFAMVDWNLPAMTGFDFLKRVRGEKKLDKMRVAMFTVRDSEEEQLLAYSQRTDLYITKPVVPEILLEKIRNVLTRKELSAQRRIYESSR